MSFVISNAQWIPTSIFLVQVYQQHAHGFCVPDSGLLLLHGSQSSLPGWVSPHVYHASFVINTAVALVSLMHKIEVYLMHEHLIAILKINGEKLLKIQDDGGFLKSVPLSSPLDDFLTMT